MDTRKVSALRREAGAFFFCYFLERQSNLVICQEVIKKDFNENR